MVNFSEKFILTWSRLPALIYTDEMYISVCVQHVVEKVVQHRFKVGLHLWQTYDVSMFKELDDLFTYWLIHETYNK